MHTQSHPEKLHLLVFGATGRTGKYVVNIALDKDYTVTAVVRNPSALAIMHPLLTIVKGDILQSQSFATHMFGKDAVISCTGSDATKPTKLYSQGMQNILMAMQAAGVKRVLCMSASAVVINPTLPVFYRLLAKYVVQKILKHPFADIKLMEKILEHSDANFTIVRPPQLTNKPLTGKYRYAVNSFLKKALRIRRADLAHFMVNNITNTETYRAIIEVAN